MENIIDLNIIKKNIYKLIIVLICIDIIENTYENTEIFSKNWQNLTLMLILSNLIYYLFISNICNICNNKDIKLIIILLLYEFLLGYVNIKQPNYRHRSIKLFYLILGYNIYNFIKKNGSVYNINNMLDNILKLSIGFILSEYMINYKISDKNIVSLVGMIVGTIVTMHYDY